MSNADQQWIDSWLLNMRGITKDYKVEWDWMRYQLGGKLAVALGTHKDGRPIVTLKCEPALSEVLRANNPNIIEGYYMNKTHWISVYLDAGVTQEELRPLLELAYKLVYSSLTKKQQKALEEDHHE